MRRCVLLLTGCLFCQSSGSQLARSGLGGGSFFPSMSELCSFPPMSVVSFLVSDTSETLETKDSL